MSLKTDHMRSYNPVSMYLSKENASPSLTANGVVGATSISVDSITNVNAGDVITLYCNFRYYQSLVTGTAAGTINLATPLDCAFPADICNCSVGDWQMNANGSGAALTYSIIPPLQKNVHLCSMHITILTTTKPEWEEFGDLAALTNGVFMQLNNHTAANLWVVVNLLGFAEYGFQVEVISALSKYSTIVNKNIVKEHGTSILLIGTERDRLDLVIRDDLTGLESLTCVCHGHLV